MKEIGGYFELESFGSPEYHDRAIKLNSGRNALRYIIRAYGIREMLVPRYTCPVVFEALAEENCKVIFYSIDEKLNPSMDIDGEMKQNKFVLYNNYFGVCGNVVERLIGKYTNVIVDSAQSFYSLKKGIASFYSPRKFFGLPDGGILRCDKELDDKFEEDISIDRCSHLLKRYDLPATEGYPDFQRNDNSLIGQPIKHMSKLTQALMSNINYSNTRKIRMENFSFLHDNLWDDNELKIDMAKDDVPLVYPFLLKNKELRKKLIERRVYVATYWPELEKYCDEGSFELYLKNYLIPIPIDQRYGLEEMKFILGII